MQEQFGTTASTLPSNVDVDGHILTNPNHVAKHSADYFVNKVNMKMDNSRPISILPAKLINS